jgi:L-ascorbate metabolism protein UlaG (beta-lactamase superfamily)
MRVTYYGQACILVEVAGRKIVTDPWLTEGAYQGTWFHTHVLADAGVTPQSFPKDIDYVFLSHEHQDHTDVATLEHFPKEIPILISRFATPKFHAFLMQHGFTNIKEVESGKELDLGEGLKITIFGTAEYTNDSAILIEHDGVRVFNETDCKLTYQDLQRLGQRGVDIGFYMFSGANWYPIRYDYPAETMLELVKRRRSALLRSLVQRVKLTKPKFAVPAAGPCTVLDPELLWMNSEDRGIFIDPAIAVAQLQSANIGSEAVNMAASDVWDSHTGIERCAPAMFRVERAEYIQDASKRMASSIARAKAAEPPAREDLAKLIPTHFNELVAIQTPEVRKRINAKLALRVLGAKGGDWTVDFTSSGPDFVREGLLPDWTYKIEVEDKLISPFMTGEEPFLEDLLLSLRFEGSRRPDEYNEPLYHFLYEPDPVKLHNWYATR